MYPCRPNFLFTCAALPLPPPLSPAQVALHYMALARVRVYLGLGPSGLFIHTKALYISKIRSYTKSVPISAYHIGSELFVPIVINNLLGLGGAYIYQIFAYIYQIFAF